jgi:hypothetical protein
VRTLLRIVLLLVICTPLALVYHREANAAWYVSSSLSQTIFQAGTTFWDPTYGWSVSYLLFGGGSLKELMIEISRKAQERGPTPEALNSILHDS